MFAFPCRLTAVVAFALFTLHDASVSWSADEVRFNRDVRPILSARCFACHGPDNSKREADLQLDTEKGIRYAFSGSLTESIGWERISSDDPSLVMPPRDSHLQLKPAEITTLKRWVEQGAAWEGHWSFTPPARPPVPAVQNIAWVRNPIDAFILARLENAGLSPNGDADKERLLRRVTFDLTGLPPTLAEIDAFLADDSPDAYERVVDRLLKSPHFGERMAVAWMDAARYGDTSVFHADGPRDMWPWREWVIRSYNENKPFDEFTVEQLAGDLLPSATTEQKLATGFLRNNATTDEGGAIAEEFRIEYAVDRVKTTSMVWLGLSLECAQCHSHKYDPISQEEYYQFFAYFNQASDPGMQTRQGNQTPVVDLFDEKRLARADELKQQAAELESRRDRHLSESTGDFERWLADASAKAGDGALLPSDVAFHAALDETAGRQVADLVAANRKGQVKGPPQWADGKFGNAFACNAQNYVDFGDVADFERTDAFSYGCWIKPQGQANGTALARMDDGNAHRGFDLHLAGGVVQVHLIHTWPTNALKVRTKAQLKPDQWQHVFVTYDGSSKAAGVKVYFDGKPQAFDVEQDRLTETVRTKVPLYLGRRNPGSPFRGLIDDVRIYRRTLAEAEVAALAGSDPVTPLLAKSPTERSEADRRVLQRHYWNVVDKTAVALAKQITDLETQAAELSKPVVNVMIMQDVSTMRPTYVLDRGNYASPLKDRAVRPGVPAVLPPLPKDAPANRLGLARWLTQPDHPLTARVAVNRYWAMLFGEGIVRTVADFGAQGEWPTHPALLDWLAVDFVESGWNVKRMLKQMVMSSSYRQSSRVEGKAWRAEGAKPNSDSQLSTLDPQRLYARGPRFRLQAEFIRDNALAASGLLVDTIGGPGVKPYQPPGLWNEVSLSGNVRFVQDHGADLYRRSLYTYWKRSAPAPAMTIFDTPSRETCVLRRSRTNTPLQALVTLNDVQFVEAARALAERVVTEGGSSLDEQIVTAYRLATGVRPTPEVLEILRNAYHEELPVFQAEPERAAKLLSVGESPRDSALDPAVHAAMTIVTSTILNLDETLTRG